MNIIELGAVISTPKFYDGNITVWFENGTSFPLDYYCSGGNTYFFILKDNNILIHEFFSTYKFHYFRFENGKYVKRPCNLPNYQMYLIMLDEYLILYSIKDKENLILLYDHNFNFLDKIEIDMITEVDIPHDNKLYYCKYDRITRSSFGMYVLSVENNKFVNTKLPQDSNVYYCNLVSGKHIRYTNCDEFDKGRSLYLSISDDYVIQCGEIYYDGYIIDKCIYTDSDNIVTISFPEDSEYSNDTDISTINFYNMLTNEIYYSKTISGNILNARINKNMILSRLKFSD